MKALVTGGAGFIGSHVVRCLHDDGHDLRILHLPDEDVSHLRDLKNVEFVTGDTRDAERMKEIAEGCDWVFHLAAIYRIWMEDFDPLYEVNVDGTRNVMEASIEAGVDRVVYTSSLVVFEPREGEPLTEKNPIRDYSGEDHYTRSKIESHRLVQEYAEQGHDIVTVCPTLPIGPGDRGPTPTGKILLSALENPIAMVIDSRANCGDVRDIARGHVLAAEKGKTGESYLIGGDNVSMQNLSQLVLDVAGTSKPMFSPPLSVIKGFAWIAKKYSDWISGERPDFTPAAVEIAHSGFDADCSKARRELDLPNRDLKESVRDALEWFRDNGYVDY